MTCKLIAAVALTALLAACGDDTATGGGGGAANTGGAAAGGAASSGGAAQGGNAQGGAPTTFGGDRPVELQVPSSYDPATPTPLVILLHGYSASGALQESYFKLGPEAEARGVLYAHPDGLKDGMNNQYWNSLGACCDFYQTNVDDSGYLIGLVDEIAAAYNVDPKRVYFVGHSNGGFMSFRMACDHADRVAAIVALAGAMPADIASCQPSEPVSVLAIHGTADATIAYAGGALGPEAFPGALETIGDWATLDGCSVPAVDGAAIDFEPVLVGAETTPSSFDCPPPVDVTLWTIEGGSHIPALPGDFAARVFDFLLAHSK